MDVSAFEDLKQSFAVADLSAKFEWKSESSAGFHLGRFEDTIDFGDGSEPMDMGPGGVFNVVGELEVHHPCDGHVRLRIRSNLPQSYHSNEAMTQIVTDIRTALLIDEDEIFDILLVASGELMSMSNRRDRLT